jgi:signal transduction histidine kinase
LHYGSGLHSMFRVPANEPRESYRVVIIGLLLLSAAALIVTLWIMFDFLKEQEIVAGLIEQLPPDSTNSAETLAGELRWQFRLAILVALNLIVTGIAVQLLWKAYRSSEQSLMRIKALANDILTSVDQAVITTDLTGKITSLNRRGFEILGISEDLVGQPLEAISTNFPIASFWKMANVEEGGKLSEKLSPAPPTAFRANFQPLRNHQDVIIGSVIQLRDITEQSLTEDRLRRIERYMGLGSLATGLHHEIKNPLAALSLHVQLLDEQMQDDESQETRETIGIIRSEVNRVGGVLENFRDYASIEKLHKTEVRVSDLVRSQINLIRPQANARSIEIEVLHPEKLESSVFVDYVRMEQVLLNVFVNGMDSMPEGGMLSVKVTQTGNKLNIRIADTGSGISESAQKHIFDPYFTTKSNGTGMGLALCDKIIRQHDGTIEFSTGERGTTFEIAIPIIRKHEGLSTKG